MNYIRTDTFAIFVAISVPSPSLTWTYGRAQMQQLYGPKFSHENGAGSAMF